jgi:formylglycine-generating enzyme required for sulfatase activity
LSQEVQRETPSLSFVAPENKIMSEEGVSSSLSVGKTKAFLSIPLAEMAYVPGGTFQMGAIGSQTKAGHEVTLSSFWMGKYEVTQAQWQSVMGTQIGKFRKNCPECPVGWVSWWDAIEFCNKLSVRDGKRSVYTINGTDVQINMAANGYRLPTEAEWEFAAGGGATNRTLFGNGKNTLMRTEANYVSNLEVAALLPVYIKLITGRKRVGTYSPNSLGLYDMSGNMMELCQDWFGAYTYQSQVNPLGATIGKYKVIRGGSWQNAKLVMRVNKRMKINPRGKGGFFGFRIVANVNE